jgi:carbon monoxide dehydrogenase subunit G
MKPVRVSIDVPQPREQVYDFLDVMSNHEPFTDHILKHWRYSGPERGIGSRAQVQVTTGGRTDTIDIEVVSARRPETIVERNVGARGKRIANGTYVLEQLADGGTRIVFEYSWQQAPLSERVASPLVRGVLRRGNERAMQRLAEQLETKLPAPAV